jgi:hypothetical protein
MFKQIIIQTLILFALMDIIFSQPGCAEEPNDFRTGFSEKSDSLNNDPYWYGILRTGYSIASRNSYHPVDKGSFALSGGFYVRLCKPLSLGWDFGYQRWQNKIEGETYSSCDRCPYAFWNVAGVFTLHTPYVFPHQQVDPFIMCTLGIYGRYFENSQSGNQKGPGFSYGLGVRYIPDRRQLESGPGLGFGIIIRRHTMLLDDYGAWFVGPSFYWTKTFEAAAEIILSW